MSSLDYLDLCRLCLVKDRVSVPIFDGEGDVRQIFLKIAACLPVKVAREDKLPKKICDDCVYKVELFYQFWNTTANAEKQLLQWLGDVGLEEKQGYVSEVLSSEIMKQEESENRLDVSVMQATGEHTDNMAINIIDDMNLGIPIIMSTDQQITVPINSNNNVQTGQSVPGPSARSTHDQVTPKSAVHDAEEDTSEDDNTDDDCDADEGLAVKEEGEDTTSGNRAIEPTTFVNVALACDEAGPSGLQQQKLVEMPTMGIQQSSEGDPKSGYIKSTQVDGEDRRGIFLFEHESVVMRKWQILEFDGKPYYAFVPENETPIDTDDIPIAENTEEFNLHHDNLTHCKLEETHEDENNDELMGDDASFYDYEYNDCEILDDEDVATNDVKPISMNGIVNGNDKNTQGDLYQVKVEGTVVTIEKLAENVLELKDNNDNASNTEEKRINECEFRSDNDEEEQEDLDESEEAMESVMIEDEDRQIHQVPQYIDGDSMESQIIEYLSDEREEEEEEEEEEEDVDDVEAIEEETLVQVSPSIQSRNQRQSRYRPILPNTSVALKCKACSETFGSALAFRKHVAWTHKKKVCIQEDGAYICAVCDYRTMKKSLFATHLERKHETWPRKGHNSLVFPCAVCGFVCRSKHSLQSHFIRKHTDKYEHQCKFCPKKFKVKGDLTNHVRFHHKEKPINCDVCGKLCQNTGSLYVHQKWAHYKPKFECTICKRRMVTQENLAQHMVTQHEKREKIVCAECGKTFTKKDSFKRHMAVHTGSKPHPCPICNKPFARQSQLRQHVLIHTGKRPFVCDICGKAFTQKPGLICHRKTHPGLHPPLPVMPIADLVKEFTAVYLQESANVIDEVEQVSE